MANQAINDMSLPPVPLAEQKLKRHMFMSDIHIVEVVPAASLYSVPVATSLWHNEFHLYIYNLILQAKELRTDKISRG